MEPAASASRLESRYLEACQRQDVPPNPSVLASFGKVKFQTSCHELCILDIYVDQLAHHDFLPLIEAISASKLSGIDVVDVRQESHGSPFKGKYVLSLLRAIKQKLRIVDLCDWLFWKDVLCFTPACFSCMPNLMRLSMCETQIVNLWTTTSALSKLTSLIELRFQNCLCCYDTGECSIDSGCESVPFACRTVPPSNHSIQFNTGQPSVFTERLNIPNDEYIFNDVAPNSFHSDDDDSTSHSLQSSSVNLLDSDLEFSGYPQNPSDWMGRLPDLTLDLELEISMENLSNETADSTPVSRNTQISVQHTEEANFPESTGTETINDFHVDMYEDFNSDFPRFHSSIDENEQYHLDEQVSASLIMKRNEENDTNMPNIGILSGSEDVPLTKHISHHPSPICFEKYYREYMVASLPHLKVLDNIQIKDEERDKANLVFTEHFEQSPYNRSRKENVVGILKNREIGINISMRSSSTLKQSYSSRNTCASSRSLSAAKVNSCPWPYLNPLPKFSINSREEMKSFRPRQFEYHPSDSSLMVFGTLDGEIVVINHETGKIAGYVPSTGALQSILGLCWLKQQPSKLIAGSDNGSLKLYDISQLSSVLTDRCWVLDTGAISFDDFEHLTSVHVNSTDNLFLASGFSKHVALYDIGSGRRLEVFKDLHAEHINVVKFSNHSPSIFATASFDQDIKMWDLRQGPSRPCYTVSSSRGNVMVCFSPDDHYLLSSAVDNEVKQLLSVDGRVHTSFNIASTGSVHNYTRSYYMNGRDYVISGSSEENVVRVCSAQTGRRLRDIYLEGRGSRNSLFVQSLRGDPFRVFHMSVLAAYLRPSSKSEIIRVNLLSSGFPNDDDSSVQLWHPSNCMGG